MSQSISFLPATQSLASSYDRTKPAASQPAPDIPATFKAAMTIRERVYVEEQNVPLENEFDEDDPRSFHWVAYVDRVAVGTIRLVPPPHPPHPVSADAHDPGSSGHTGDTHATGTYIKLGRLAVLPNYRKLKLAALLVRTALEWAARDGCHVLSPQRPEGMEVAKVESAAGELEPWNGLVLVHAQSWLERFWGKFGFVKDEEMGEWDEEGISHCGMWLRLKLQE